MSGAVCEGTVAAAGAYGRGGCCVTGAGALAGYEGIGMGGPVGLVEASTCVGGRGCVDTAGASGVAKRPSDPGRMSGCRRAGSACVDAGAAAPVAGAVEEGVAWSGSLLVGRGMRCK